MKNKQKVYEFLLHYSEEFTEAPKLDTTFLSAQLHMQRSNVSALLNTLVVEGKVKKYKGRPVLYQIIINQDEAFTHLYGSETFLKEPIETMKAALHFPDDVKKILIVATSGSGTSAFAREACTYAYVNRMVSRDEVVEIDLSEDSKDNFIDKEGFYLIKNAQKLTRVQREKCLHTLKGIVIFQVDRNEDVSLFDEVRFIIHLPSLNSLTLEDRYGLIEYFFLDESKRLDDRIIVNVGLMQCLLVYPCVNGIKEMKREIAKGIANAYRREKNHTLTLELSDFSPNVRKGLLNMKNRQDVMEFIAHTALFIFDHETTLQTREKDIEADLYQITYKKRLPLIHTINTVGVKHLGDNVRDYVHDLYTLYDQSGETQLMNNGLRQEVIQFFKEAGETLHRSFTHDYIFGVAMHLQDTVLMASTQMQIDNTTMMDIIETYNQEYLLSRKFIRRVEEDLQKKLSPDESLFFTLFLSVMSSEKLGDQVVNLVAMHGQGASAIASVVSHLMPKCQLYAFDMPLDENINEVYERLKALIVSIDQGKGVHVIYDMGSINVMLSSISEETHIRISTLEVPISLLLMSAIKLADQGYTLEVIHNRLLDYASTSQVVKNVNEKFIVAFSKSQEHKSEEIKNRLEVLDGADGYKIYHFEADDTKSFVKQLDFLLMVGNLAAIVGTFDPAFFNVRYIDEKRIDQVSSISELLEEKEEYFDILGYLESQFEAFNRQDLEATIVPFMNDYERILNIHLDEDDYVGLMVHMACLIDRLMKNKTPTVNFDSDKIILKYPQETRELTKSLEPIEKYFHISFLKGDVATLISIVKR